MKRTAGIVLVLLVAAFGALKFACQRQTEARLLPAEREALSRAKNETPEEKAFRMAWWRAARFGLFIHWGLYAIPAGTYRGVTRYSEWIMREARIPVREYEKFALRFNPKHFDPDEWVRLARRARMGYVVFTSKHHEGFCMFDSELTDYDVVDATPYGRDVLGLLANACRRQGLRLGIYYSVWDWHHPDARRNRHTRYFRRYMHPQLQELIRKYDPDILWFDIGQEPIAKAAVACVRSLKPSILVNDRAGWDGDFATPEQHVPTRPPSEYWETNMTMNHTWGYTTYDTTYRSSEEIIWHLTDAVSKGGNFLLNVGPDADGRIPAPSVERLQAIGEWMDINSGVVFASRPWPVPNYAPAIRYLLSEDGDTVYAVCRGPLPPEVNLREVKPVPSAKIRVLGSHRALPWRFDRRLGLFVRIPGREIQGLPRPICLQIPGSPAKVADPPDFRVLPQPSRDVKAHIFVDTAVVELSSDLSGAHIFYSVDGSEPDFDSPRYEKPLVLRRTCTIRAFVWRPGYIASRPAWVRVVKPAHRPGDPDYLLGVWQDARKQADIRFFKQGGRYFGRIERVWDEQPGYAGLVIARNFIYDGMRWKGGTITDPTSGETYRCTLRLIAPDQLEVRGYIGMPLFGRSEIWQRVE